MTPQELTIILDSLRSKPSETEIVEFKKAANTFDNDDLGKYFSALSNEANLKNQPEAWLVFGIDNDTHQAVGTNYKPTRPSLDEVKKKIADQTTNRITFDEIYELMYGEKRIVMFQIPAAPRGIPIAYQGHYYGRDGESLVALNLHEIELIRGQARAQEDWSAEIVDGATLDDLDEEAIKKARKQYSDKHPKLAKDVESWSDRLFLNNAKVTRNGRITNTAIILLGKPESEVMISPAVSKIRWIVKDHMGTERDYEIFTCPMILAVENVASKIRNLKYRFIDPAKNTIFPEEMDTYEPYVIREATNNAIAHQCYARGGMVNVVEFEDRLVFTNLGGFIPGSVRKVLTSDAPEETYQNKFLASAMVELGMVDTIGSGIKRMYGYQQMRRFPMPLYDFSDEKVKLTIYGKVLDDKYFKMLCYHPELSLVDMEVMTKVQLGGKLTEDENLLLTELNYGKEAYDTPSDISNVVSKLSDRQIFVYQKIKDNPLVSITEMSQALGVTTRTIDRDVAVLRNRGYVSKSERDNRSPWVILKNLE